ncbi:MAG: response regulator [Isosphaeraceae bacterium]
MCADKCLLIVDDEPNVRLMLRTALESSGYRVAEAVDGLSALEQIGSEAGAFAMVLLDLRMPRIDGMETLRRIRERRDPTPVVMLTAHGSVPDAVAAMKLGAIDFLAKPVTPSQLRAVVADVIARNAAIPAAAPVPAAPESRPSFGFELARAKRAINRGNFIEAEDLLREILDHDPDAQEARALRDRLIILKEREGHGSFRMLREWFPG